MEYYVVKYTALLVFGYMQTVYIHNKSLEYPPFKYIYIYMVSYTKSHCSEVFRSVENYEEYKNEVRQQKNSLMRSYEISNNRWET